MQMTERSKYLAEIALELSSKADNNIAQEIALVGSVSRGQSDEFSDVELSFFLPEIPGDQDRKNWLESVGVHDVVLDLDPLYDGSMWASGLYKDVPVEVGWQSFAAQEGAMDKVVNAQTTEHWLVMSMWSLLSAKPLKQGRYLDKWQNKLSTYPIPLRDKLINRALETWFYPNDVLSRLASAKRHELLNFYTMITADINALLRIIFALNNAWEPNWKWAFSFVNDLKIKPTDLTLKIFQILREEPLQGVGLYYNLVMETLKLAQGTVNVDIQLQNLFLAQRECEKIKIGIK